MIRIVLILCCLAVLCSCKTTHKLEKIREEATICDDSTTLSFRELLYDDSLVITCGSIAMDMYAEAGPVHMDVRDVMISRRRLVMSQSKDSSICSASAMTHRESETDEVTEPPSGVSDFCSYAGYIALLVVFFVAVVICLKLYNVLNIRSK